MIKKYRRKPITVEAARWIKFNTTDILRWGEGKIFYHLIDDTETPEILIIHNADGSMKSADIGDYIVKINNEFFVYKEEEFWKEYEEM